MVGSGVRVSLSWGVGVGIGVGAELGRHANRDALVNWPFVPLRSFFASEPAFLAWTVLLAR